MLRHPGEFRGIGRSVSPDAPDHRQAVADFLQRELPAVGSKVVTARGQGRVLALEVLARKVLVEFDDRRRIVVASGDILGVEAKARSPRGDDDDRVEH